MGFAANCIAGRNMAQPVIYTVLPYPTIYHSDSFTGSGGLRFDLLGFSDAVD
jgi:hypothetical protein